MADISWVPDFKEFLLYLITIVLIILMIRLFHHNHVQKIMRKTSRCLRESRIGQMKGVYSVKAFTPTNKPMYTVSYNLRDKTSSLDCACNKGTQSNTFRTKLFNLRDPSAGSRSVQKVCLCDELIDDASTTYYSGYPGLIRYMYTGDQSFFNSALEI